MPPLNIHCRQYILEDKTVVSTMDGSPIAHGYGWYSVGILKGSAPNKHPDGTLDGFPP